MSMIAVLGLACAGSVGAMAGALAVAAGEAGAVKVVVLHASWRRWPRHGPRRAACA